MKQAQKSVKLSLCMYDFNWWYIFFWSVQVQIFVFQNLKFLFPLLDT